MAVQQGVAKEFETLACDARTLQISIAVNQTSATL